MSFETPKTNPNPLFKPFDKDELFKDFDDLIAKAKNCDEVLPFYKEKISDKLSYEIEFMGKFIYFFVIDENDNALSNFIFRVEEDNFTLQHRTVNNNLKELSINGSTLLKKSEEFLTLFLEKSGNTKIDKIVIESGQVGVTNWALKNGYQFKNEKEKEKYDKIISGEEDDYVITDDFVVEDRYNNYIFTKDNYEKAKIAFSAKREDDKKDVDLRVFSERFELIKEIKKN